MKRIVGSLILFAAILILLPSILVLPFGAPEMKPQTSEGNQMTKEKITKAVEVDVPVFRSDQKETINIPIEDYVKGVVAAEMPSDFNMEALKAQALTARTFVVTKLKNPSANLPDQAVVTDTIQDQVYKDQAQLKKAWGEEFDEKFARIEEAVQATSGQILTYEGNPIYASFFSTSNGYTENSEDYWENQAPYLRSVESPWDVDSPKYEDKATFTVAEFEQKLGVALSNNSIGSIENLTEGKRVAEVSVGGKTFTGREIRDLLGLRSSDFTWERVGDTINVVTKGYGHGVGMSQYGANGMAEDGKAYADIVKHYYQGVAISEMENYVTDYTAQR
ncbi:stage II sporulation protein D [Bacillus hwajinpoensis]|uniref:Stage II sporulation protein D n=1 Tax=Guptibacillus hwajinpoensis TaxID=208199 RepID=A0A845ERK2_9BACL|nr:stage II sporulation protein D [Pseudalkalibacillus hwajinpoensis]MYL62339.1 stage II sporulation protein D [Pseudalkalibacillus hwajinpoensis]